MPCPPVHTYRIYLLQYKNERCRVADVTDTIDPKHVTDVAQNALIMKLWWTVHGLSISEDYAACLIVV